MADSKVQIYVEGTRMMLESSPGSEPRRVTVRLDPLKYAALVMVATELDDSPTGCAQSLLSYAIEDAVIALGYKSYEEAIPDINRLAGLKGEAESQVEVEAPNSAKLSRKQRREVHS